MRDCDSCSNYCYDDELEEWLCEAYMDEDDTARLYQDSRARCPYWHSNDEYRMVKHQAIGHLPGYSDSGYFPEDKLG